MDKQGKDAFPASLGMPLNFQVPKQREKNDCKKDLILFSRLNRITCLWRQRKGLREESPSLKLSIY